MTNPSPHAAKQLLAEWSSDESALDELLRWSRRELHGLAHDKHLQNHDALICEFKKTHNA